MTAYRADRGRGWSVAGAACLVLAVAGGLDGCSGKDRAAAPPETRVSATPAVTPSAPGATPVPAGSAAPVAEPYAPTIDRAAFGATVDNPYFPLLPGMRWEYRAETEDGVETTLVRVSGRTRTVMGVVCVEVRDTVRLDGEVVEDTLDWYAQHRDGTVWYFGEDTKEYENGRVARTEGSWEAGVHGAMPGIMMPARPRAGDRYRQEYYRGEAEDIAEVVSIDERARVPQGSYDGVVETRETTPLEPAAVEHKYYARGIGPVLTIDVAGGGTRDELTSFSR